MSKPVIPPDKELAEIFGNNTRIFRAMRELFQQAGTTTPDDLNAVILSAGNAEIKANQANETINNLADALSLLALRPEREESNEDFLDNTPPFVIPEIDTVALFQAQKTILQVSTTSFEDIIEWGTAITFDTWGGSWGTSWGTSWTVSDGIGAVVIQDSVYSFNLTTGVLTINDTGWFDIEASYISVQTGNSDLQGQLKIIDSSGDIAGAFDSQYVSANTTQDEGSCQISGFIYQVDTIGETINLQIKHTGAANDLTAARLSVKKIKDL